MITLIYVGIAVISLLPWSYLIRTYADKIDLKRVMKEIKDISDKIKQTPPKKEKKLRILNARYNELKRKVSKFFFVNLFILWAGVFASLIVTRYISIIAALTLGIEPLPPSPLSIPGISIDGYLNDLILYLAILLAYQNLHNKITGVSIIREFAG